MPVMGNLLWYTYAKNYQNRAWFDKVIAKIKWCSFFDSHGMFEAKHSHYNCTDDDAVTVAHL